MKKFLIGAVLAMATLSANAENPLIKSPVLSADQAYTMMYGFKDGELQIRWQIAPGYNLYKHGFGFSNGATAEDMPKGIIKEDSYFGEVELYSGMINVTVDYSKVKEESIFVTYQGCKLNVICYPPQKKEIRLPIKR